MTLITMSRAVGKGMGDTLIDAFLSLFGEDDDFPSGSGISG